MADRTAKRVINNRLYEIKIPFSDFKPCITKYVNSLFQATWSKNRSTEGCPKLKSPETRQAQEILVSTLEHLQAPEVGQDQVSGGVSVPCRHATPAADALWKPITVLQISYMRLMTHFFRLLRYILILEEKMLS